MGIEWEGERGGGKRGRSAGRASSLLLLEQRWKEVEGGRERKEDRERRKKSEPTNDILKMTHCCNEERRGRLTPDCCNTFFDTPTLLHP